MCLRPSSRSVRLKSWIMRQVCNETNVHVLGMRSSGACRDLLSRGDQALHSALSRSCPPASFEPVRDSCVHRAYIASSANIAKHAAAIFFIVSTLFTYLFRRRWHCIIYVHACTFVFIYRAACRASRARLPCVMQQISREANKTHHFILFAHTYVTSFSFWYCAMPLLIVRGKP